MEERKKAFAGCADDLRLVLNEQAERAEGALSGVKSPIPCDEVIDAMGAVGRALPSTLRETGEGGLAATPTARRLTGNL